MLLVPCRNFKTSTIVLFTNALTISSRARHSISCLLMNLPLFQSDSLDTKLLSMQPGGTPSVVLQSLQLPEPLPSWALYSCDGGNGDDTKMRGSPVSSRSESPLSDAKSAGFGRFSTHFYGMSRTDLPYTDSDGLYDYPSSETVLPPSSIPRRHARKCDRRRERKTSLKSSRVDHHHREFLGNFTPTDLFFLSVAHMFVD